MGESKSFVLIVQEIWEFLISTSIMITAEYLPNWMFVQADWQSRHSQNSTEWKLNTTVFKKISQHLSFCFSSDKTNRVFSFLETKQLLQGSKRSPKKMDPYAPLCVSTVLPVEESNRTCWGQNRDNLDYKTLETLPYPF